METIQIRSAEPKDLELLYVFEQGVINAERPFDPTLKDDLIHYYDLQGMIGADTVELAVAEIKGEVIGSGYARIEEAKVYLKHQQHAYLGFMYVLPDYRGLGVNKKIIEHLVQWASQKNIREFRLDVYFDNVSAIKAYEKIGFTKHMIEMRLGTSSEKDTFH